MRPDEREQLGGHRRTVGTLLLRPTLTAIAEPRRFSFAITMRN